MIFSNFVHDQSCSKQDISKAVLSGL